MTANKQSDTHVTKFRAEVEQSQQELAQLLLQNTLDLYGHAIILQY